MILGFAMKREVEVAIVGRIRYIVAKTFEVFM